MLCLLVLMLSSLTWNTVARDILGDDFHFIDGYRSNNTMLRYGTGHFHFTSTYIVFVFFVHV